ncbi:phosphotransferase [Paenibacillus rigui]|nr:phosphotransferase [Paenibacillus rigui]
MEQSPQLNELLRQYFGDSHLSIACKESGVNNTTLFVTHNGSTYVLRIYDNHADVDKVKFELAVLEQLKSHQLSFQVPEPVPTLDGELYGRVSPGKIAVLFRYIEGERADLAKASHVYQIGRAAGELVTSLAQVRVQAETAYEPYYELYAVHPLVTPDKLNEWIDSLLEGNQAREAELLREAIQQLEHNMPRLLQLPFQLVHSDLVGGNVLSDGGRISGILDFEFVTSDLRVMEAAVFISELVRHHRQHWELIEAFVQGYSTTASLSNSEIEALPQLVLLRSLVLCIHFLGRHWAIGDQVNKPEAFLASFAEVHAWLESHKVQLVGLCRAEMELN